MKPEVAWILWVGLVVAPTVGHAEPGASHGSLRWSRAASAANCIAEAALAADVERLLERRVFRPPQQPSDLRVDGRVERAGAEGWRATLTLSSGDGVVLGHRELHEDAVNCGALDESLALAIALMIDPDAVLIPDASKPASVASPELKEDAASIPEPPILERRLPIHAEQLPSPLPNRTRAQPWRLEAQAEATLAFGLLPSTGIGLAARLLLSPPSFWSVAVEGIFWRKSDAESSSFGSNIGLQQGGVLVCPLDLRGRRLSLLSCAGMQVGRMSAAGFGFDPNYADASTLFDATAQARARFRVIGPLTALLGASVGVPLNPYRFVYRDANENTLEVFRVAPVFASLDFGIGAEWP